MPPYYASKNTKYREKLLWSGKNPISWLLFLGMNLSGRVVRMINIVE
jgi:hypothetical protein